MSTPAVTDHLQQIRSAGALFAALALLGVLIWAVWFTNQPPAPQDQYAPPETFSATRAISRLKAILPGDEPHPVGSAANARVRERLVERLIGMGFNVDTQAAFSCSAKWAVCAPVRNVIATLPGETDQPAVMLAAHYDSVPAGPGVADDGNGLAVLLETARILKREGPFHNPVIFLFTDGEEAGLLGAEAFVKQQVWRRQVGVVLNFEARGTTGASLMFETSDNNEWLIRVLARAAAAPDTASYMTAAYKRMPNDTDLSVFKRAGLAGMNFAFAGGQPRYHTPVDDFTHLDPASVQHQGDNALATARALAGTNLSERHHGDAVFTDILAQWLVWWPSGWTFPLAAFAALIGFSALFWLWRLSRFRGRELVWGLIAWWGVVAAPTALGLALVYGACWVTGSTRPWLAQPIPMTVALWLAVLVGGGVTASWAGRRAGVWGLLCGSLSWWWLVALTLGALLPALDAVILIPAVIGAIMLMLAVLSGASRSPRSAALVSIITALAIGTLWFKIGLLMPVMFGLKLSPMVTIPVGLVFTGLAPLFAVAETRRSPQRWVLGISFICMGIAFAAAVRVPFYTKDLPMALNMTYIENDATGDAVWRTGRPDMQLPSDLRKLALFSDTTETFAPWEGQGAYLAKAKPWHQPAPALEVVNDKHQDHIRTLTVRLRSRRHAQTGMLFVKTQPHLLSATLNGEQLNWMTSDRAPGANGYRPIIIDGLPRAGIKLTFRLTGDTPLEVIAADRSGELPPVAQPLLDARPPNYTPKGAGDTSVLFIAKKL